MNSEYARWSAIYQGTKYYYGFDAGPVARRAVRYHHPLLGGAASSALDIGCGEGQDLAFLASCGYEATGVDFVPSAVEKAKRLLEQRQLEAHCFQSDLREWDWSGRYDLVLAVNCLQFLGEDALGVLKKVQDSVAPGGVLGLSLFACETGNCVQEGVFFTALPELMKQFDCEGTGRSWQMLETAQLWQWNANTNAPQPFVTIIAQRTVNEILNIQL